MSDPVMLTTASIVVRNGDLIAAEVEGEIVALDADRDACYGLNAVGSRIWRMMERPQSVAAICAVLLKEYEVDPETCERQVLALLEDLRGAGMIAMADAATDEIP